ncbi:lipoyl(octanoyl) transferase LipB [Burkholderia sp. TSV86]|uniref:lipoyl(octanoyl) transferase LipB n=1 Tax=Burkholderia sp. TSV86 TaxID=1385594 RepID=UPI000754737D|nr:lipoyl(octanoyl) transferase LipB [Burkholderia sp. TSV86]KVE38146.1 lipoate--protein ligase [Burkholderia sp. TSV86]
MSAPPPVPATSLVSTAFFAPDAAVDVLRSPSGLPVTVRWLGRRHYDACFDAMRAFTESRGPDTGDEIWVVEHPPVYTLGQAGDPAHLLVADTGVPLVKVDRGGQITYHGPGQIVAYLLVDLRRRKLMVRTLVSRIEDAVIETLAAYNLASVRKAGAPGIYVESGPHRGAKIAALGLKIRSGCSYHGLSVNVKMELSPFLSINPCGYAGLETVDMASVGVDANWREVAETLVGRLIANLDGAATPGASPPQQAMEQSND